MQITLKLDEACEVVKAGLKETILNNRFGDYASDPFTLSVVAIDCSERGDLVIDLSYQKKAKGAM